jgi:adenylate kinase family enzyme
MTFDEASDHLAATRPSLIYISGKTCTGKTTLAKNLMERFGYRHVELDKIVQRVLVKSAPLDEDQRIFIEVYRQRTSPDLINRFVEAAATAINYHLSSGERVIFDGAIAHPETLMQLLGELPPVTFVYLHPVNIDRYSRNLIGRLAHATPTHSNGLPARFWDYIDTSEFQNYCESRELTPKLNENIRNYAIASAAESKERLNSFKKVIRPIMLIEI